MIVTELSETFEFDEKTTCCFSGHRPNKLPGNGDTVNSQPLRRIISLLYMAIYDAIDEGYTTFISGMAPGIDMWAASIVRNILVKDPRIHLVCAIPYADQSKSYAPDQLYDYNMLLNRASQVFCISDKYTPDCLRKRNQFMVDHSSKLIAVVNNYSSGTGMTINMAKRKGIDTRIIDIKKNQAMFED